MPSPSELDRNEAEKLFVEQQQIECFVFDCDGVIWKWANVFEHVPKLINFLVKSGKRVVFLTNNSSKSRGDYLRKLEGFGIRGLDRTNIVCTSWLIAQHLKSVGFSKKVYAIAERGVIDELKEVGIEAIGEGADPFPSGVDYGSVEVDLDQEVGCVVVGFDRYVSLLKILKASSYAKRNGCLLVAANDDPNFPADPNCPLVYPGTGSILSSVTTATGLSPKVLGKPHSPAFELVNALNPMNVSKCLMVGDRLETDIAFGNRNHMKTLAVFTGHTNKTEIAKEVEKDSRSERIPLYYCEGLGRVWELIQDHPNVKNTLEK